MTVADTAKMQKLLFFYFWFGTYMVVLKVLHQRIIRDLRRKGNKYSIFLEITPKPRSLTSRKEVTPGRPNMSNC